MTVVVGTKLDLVKSQGRQIGASEGRSLAVSQHQAQLDRAVKANPSTHLLKIQGNESYFETSAKTGEGVTELFQYIERISLIQLQKAGVNANRSGRSSEGATIQLDNRPSEQPNQSKGCCKN
jgi:Ras-related protein Rab-20